MSDALLVTLVVLVIALLVLNCFLLGFVADLRSRSIDDRAILRNLDSLERGTNGRVCDLHDRWVKARRSAEEKP